MFLIQSNPILMISTKKWSKPSSITVFALSLIMIFMLPFFEWITHSLSLYWEMKLIAIVNWIFCVLVFLRLFMSLKNGLILLRYSSTDGVLFL